MTAANGQVDTCLDDLANLKGLGRGVDDDGNTARVGDLHRLAQRDTTIAHRVMGNDEQNGRRGVVDRVLQVKTGGPVDGADLDRAGAGQPDHLHHRSPEVDRVSLLNHHAVSHTRRIG